MVVALKWVVVGVDHTECVLMWMRVEHQKQMEQCHMELLAECVSHVCVFLFSSEIDADA